MNLPAETSGSAPPSAIDGRADPSFETVRRALDARRRERVLRDDARDRRTYLGLGALMASPWAVIAPNLSHATAMDFTGSVIIMGISICTLFPPVLLYGALFKGPERKRLERGTPTFVPPPAVMSDGSLGPVWHPGQDDPILQRAADLVAAIDAGAGRQEILFAAEEVARRAKELVGSAAIFRPVKASRHHYWPNEQVRPGSDDSRVVSYDDNLPIEAQRQKVRVILREIRFGMSRIEYGTDGLDIAPAVIDLVAALRRVVELSGHDSSPLRGKRTPILSDDPIPAVRTADLPASTIEALDLVRRAVRLDPDTTDAVGNRVEPLTGHAMRLVAAWRSACEIADADQRRILDGQLDEAMAHVSAAARQGIDQHQRLRLERFGTELRFISSRGERDL